MSSDYSPEMPVSIWLSRAPAAPDWNELCRCLSGPEQAWMKKLGPNRQLEYCHSRWLLRQALAGATGTPANLCHPVAGRPVQSAVPGGWGLSLSHSHGIAACAVARGSSVGVDMEPADRRADWRRVVRRWFSPTEQEWLLASDSRTDFLRVWTLKEAWLKATRRGIAGNLQTLNVAADGSLTGDQNNHPWHACAGEASELTLAIVHDCMTGPGTAPGVFWLPPPDREKKRRAGKDCVRVNWWTCTEIGQGEPR
ncbi:4'-phosphopantetheinyl transferase family protein [Marinobacter sp.]|uniref:4'-phosphopantetheinyl transferase family protein n=1 Tax=Marinobacter sp. TaxID=50741 RepID=UPI00384D8720